MRGCWDEYSSRDEYGMSDVRVNIQMDNGWTMMTALWIDSPMDRVSPLG